MRARSNAALPPGGLMLDGERGMHARAIVDALALVVSLRVAEAGVWGAAKERRARRGHDADVVSALAFVSALTSGTVFRSSAFADRSRSSIRCRSSKSIPAALARRPTTLEPEEVGRILGQLAFHAAQASGLDMVEI